jgi:2,3-bisphosphoglycerate-independent phosphoglycerate mutase
VSLTLRSHPSFSGRPGPVLIVIADGVGVAPPGPSNAVTTAVTPHLDALTSGELSTELMAHGPAVGLPSDDDMGNSEVGHNALGAGRIFAQGAKLVNRALKSGAIFESDVWKSVIEHGAGGTLHFIGLHSDGGVHSTNEHLYQMLRQAAAEGVMSAAVHILHDGRDVPARSALTYIERTESELDELNTDGRNYRIASGGGRMKITMDRYGADWPMVERGYRCHTHGEGRAFASATQAVETMYAESEAGDQYLGEFVVVDGDGAPVGTIHDGDAVVVYNFRGDRSIEISRAYEEADFDVFDRTGIHGEPAPDVFFAGMLQYDGDALIPKRYLVAPPAIDRTMGEYLCAEGVRSFAISETQKFGHVTYFWNGNKSGYIDKSLETYIEIPSDNVEFDTTPAMKVREITDETIDLLRSGEYRFGRLNFPSGDMVGHTGHLDATIEAMEVIDECMDRLVQVIDELGGVLIYTADHGNADIMYTESDGVRSPKTSHTLSPVPFAIHDPNYDGEYRMAQPADGAVPGLGNVAATVFNLLGFEAPDDYLPSLITF